MFRRISMTLFAAVLPLILSAQDRIEVRVQNLVSIDETFVVSFIIEGEDSPSDFEWDNGGDFKLLYGPSRQQSTNVSIVNGKRSVQKSVVFQYVLSPLGTGRFQLPAASAVVAGVRIHSSSPTIEVVGSEDEPSRSADKNTTPGDSGPSAEREREESAQTVTRETPDLVLKLYFDKTDVVTGQSVTATLKLYKRCEIAGFDDVKFPTFTGFWSQETASPTNIEFRREKLGNTIYDAALLRKWTLTPQQTGDIVVDPVEIICLVNKRSARRMGSIFDGFFPDDIEQVRRRVSTSPVTIHVKPLPGGAPSSFGGGVGRFTMKASISRDSIRTHDASSLVVEISGNGNLSLLERPKVDFPPDFEVYDVKESESGNTKTFEYPFIPRSGGDFVIAPVRYSYFDLGSMKYVTLESAALPIAVEKVNEPDSGGLIHQSPGVDKRDVRDLGSDIRYIVTSVPKFKYGNVFFVAGPYFAAIMALLLLSALVLALVLRVRESRNADAVAVRGRSAAKMARKRLASALQYLNGNLPAAFYEELHRALLGFVADKLNMDSAEMSKDNISLKLREAGVADDVCSRFIELLDACEFARYSPDSSNDAMKEQYETAVSVISSIGSAMKGKRKGGSGASVAAAVALMLALPAHSSAMDNADSLWTSGVQQYSSGQWEAAFESWSGIAEQGAVSSELYYNMGNACFKNGEIGKSVLYYERALKLDPSNKDAAFNLEFAKSRCVDRINPVPEFFVKTWIRNVGYAFSSDVWAAMGLFLFAVLVAALLVFFTGTGARRRKAGFGISIPAFVLCALCLAFAIGQKRAYSAADSAVVMASVSEVKSSPGEAVSTDLFVLHEGATVRILEQIGGWARISVQDGHQGWILMEDVEII